VRTSEVQDPETGFGQHCTGLSNNVWGFMKRIFIAIYIQAQDYHILSIDYLQHSKQQNNHAEQHPIGCDTISKIGDYRRH
jgi:hypothetical protein